MMASIRLRAPSCRRGRDRFFPTLSMMLDILPEPYRLLISDVGVYK